MITSTKLQKGKSKPYCGLNHVLCSLSIRDHEKKNPIVFHLNIFPTLHRSISNSILTVLLNWTWKVCCYLVPFNTSEIGRNHSHFINNCLVDYFFIHADNKAEYKSLCSVLYTLRPMGDFISKKLNFNVLVA